MRYLLWSLFFSISLLTSGQVITNNAINNLTKDSIKSTIDGNTQLFYYYKSTAKKNMPLIVQLHSWSYPVDSSKTMEVDNISTANIQIHYTYHWLEKYYEGIEKQGVRSSR